MFSPVVFGLCEGGIVPMGVGRVGEGMRAGVGRGQKGRNMKR